MTTDGNRIKHEFNTAIAELLPREEVPRTKDLAKAFDLADEDNSGVVDIDEFVALYSKIKAGAVDGLGK